VRIVEQFFDHQPLCPSGNDLDIGVQYCHWLVFGMVLIWAENFVPSFTIFCFGLSGLMAAGLLLRSFTIGFPWQLFSRAAESSVFTFLKFKVVLAEASQRAIQRVIEAIGNNEIPVRYRIGEKYIESIENLSMPPNAKALLMPGENPTAIRGIF
jgi:membrane protein implicated in regulation of membrane protease activity